jgi:hypothetical protein
VKPGARVGLIVDGGVSVSRQSWPAPGYAPKGEKGTTDVNNADLARARADQEAAHQQLQVANARVTHLWDLRAVSDPGHPLYVDPTGLHWHVQRYSGDEDTYVTDTVYWALGYAASELDRVADVENDRASAAGEAGDYEAAYHASQRVQRWAGLVANARNVHQHAGNPPWLRAPRYAGPDERDNVRLLGMAAHHCVEKINSDGPDGFVMWQCPNVECAPTEDDEE